jgi:hypothetical protein
MENLIEKQLNNIFYQEDLEWLKKDLVFYTSFKKSKVKEIYKNHIEWEISQLKKLKEKL